MSNYEGKFWLLFFTWYKSIEGAQFLKQKNAVNVIRGNKEPIYYFRKKY